MASGNPKQTFRGITRAIFNRLRRRAARVGIRVASTKGEAVKDGVKILWEYDPRREQLEVECKVPFWINVNRVQADLRQQIESVIQTAA